MSNHSTRASAANASVSLAYGPGRRPVVGRHAAMKVETQADIERLMVERGAAGRRRCVKFAQSNLADVGSCRMIDLVRQMVQDGHLAE